MSGMLAIIGLFFMLVHFVFVDSEDQYALGGSDVSLYFNVSKCSKSFKIFIDLAIGDNMLFNCTCPDFNQSSSEVHCQFKNKNFYGMVYARANNTVELKIFNVTKLGLHTYTMFPLFDTYIPRNLTIVDPNTLFVDVHVNGSTSTRSLELGSSYQVEVVKHKDAPMNPEITLYGDGLNKTYECCKFTLDVTYKFPAEIVLTANFTEVQGSSSSEFSFQVEASVLSVDVRVNGRNLTRSLKRGTSYQVEVLKHKDAPMNPEVTLSGDGLHKIYDCCIFTLDVTHKFPKKIVLTANFSKLLGSKSSEFLFEVKGLTQADIDLIIAVGTITGVAVLVAVIIFCLWKKKKVCLCACLWKKGRISRRSSVEAGEKMIKNETEKVAVARIGEALALSHYYGYIKFVFEHLVEPSRNSAHYQRHKIVFIIVKTGQLPSNIKDLSLFKKVKIVKDKPCKFFLVRAGKRRQYKCKKYKMTYNKETCTLFINMPATITCLNKLRNGRVSELNEQGLEQAVEEFQTTLQKLVNCHYRNIAVKFISCPGASVLDMFNWPSNQASQQDQSSQLDEPVAQITPSDGVGCGLAHAFHVNYLYEILPKFRTRIGRRSCGVPKYPHLILIIPKSGDCSKKFSDDDKISTMGSDPHTDEIAGVRRDYKIYFHKVTIENKQDWLVCIEYPAAIQILYDMSKDNKYVNFSNDALTKEIDNFTQTLDKLSRHEHSDIQIYKFKVIEYDDGDGNLSDKIAKVITKTNQHADTSNNGLEMQDANQV